VATLRSDKDGKFQLALPAGRYTIVAQVSGADAAARTVQVQEDPVDGIGHSRRSGGNLLAAGIRRRARRKWSAFLFFHDGFGGGEARGGLGEDAALDVDGVHFFAEGGQLGGETRPERMHRMPPARTGLGGADVRGRVGRKRARQGQSCP